MLIHFRVLPEFVLEDVIDYLLFIVRSLDFYILRKTYSDCKAGFRHSPNSLELSGKNEVVTFALTFLTSTWYIKNPFLKAKLVEVCPLYFISYYHRLSPHRCCSLGSLDTVTSGQVYSVIP